MLAVSGVGWGVAALAVSGTAATVIGTGGLIIAVAAAWIWTMEFHCAYQ
jgi:hypothetical protein